MAIKIIRKPSTSFRIECENCEAIFEYGFHDIDMCAIICPCCKHWNDHRNRLKRPKESKENERLKAQKYYLHSDGRIEMIPTVESVRADTVSKMQERIRKILPQLLMESSYLDVLNEGHWLPAADQLFNGILEITEEMIEDE